MKFLIKNKTFLFALLLIFLFSYSPIIALTQQERQNLIYQIQQQILQLQAQLQAQNQLQNQTSVWCYDFNFNLSIGDSGLEVYNLKTALNKEGFLDASLINYNFDLNTYNAVVKFQEKYKSDILSPHKLKNGTGKVASSTRAKLNKIFSCSQLSGCNPSWACTEWSNCKNDKQTRRCTDSNNCKILLGKPQETQTCSVASVSILGNNIDKKLSVDYGDSIQISWSGNNIFSCSASGNWQGVKNILGVESSGFLDSSKVYNISCKDSSGEVVSDSLIVEVIMPEVEIKVNKKENSTDIFVGNYVDIEWNARGVKSCWAFGDWSGNKGLSGSELTGYLNSVKKYVYGISCISNKGTIIKKVDVNVENAVVDLKVNNLDANVSIEYNKSVNLKWTTSGVKSCIGLGDWQGTKKTSGSETIKNITGSKFYILECIDNLGNKISDSVSISTIW